MICKRHHTSASFVPRMPKKPTRTDKSSKAPYILLVSILAVLLSIAIMSSTRAFSLNKQLFNPTLYKRLRDVWFAIPS